MSLPSIQAARGWSGLTVVDSDDHPLGKIIHIYLDRDTELPEWALVAMPGRRRRTSVPLAGAARKGNRVVVAVSTAAMSDAPVIRPGRELSDDDATRLYGHYVGASGPARGVLCTQIRPPCCSTMLRQMTRPRLLLRLSRASEESTCWSARRWPPARRAGTQTRPTA